MLLLAALLPASAASQVAATVEGVQMPAWLERSEGGAPPRRVPLVPGMQLRAGDQVISGGGSRVAIKLAEGSLVKLGENGMLKLTELNATRELFKAALGVLRGAFRFTTDVAAKGRPREVSIGVANVVAGIRGTDLWGRSRDNTEIVCLIEGRVEVAAPGEAAITLDKPFQFYRREQGAARPLGFVEPKQMAEWARDTEIEAGNGAARRGGRWSALLASTEDQNAALAVRDRLREAGYPAEMRARRAAGEKLVYQVRIRQLLSKAEADALAARLRREHNL